MSFFVKGKPRTAVKHKFDTKNRKKEKTDNKYTKRNTKEDVIGKSDSEIDSDLEFRHVPDRSDSEDETETPQEKRLRLAKKYLEEIAIEEQNRAEDKEFNESVITKRLKDDYLEQSGRLRKNVAANYTGYNSANIKFLVCKEHKLSVTCLCISSNNEFIFSASKNAALVKWSLKDRRKIVSSVFHSPKENNQFCHKTAIVSMAISHDSKYLAVGDKTNDFQIWNPENLQHIHTFRGHRGSVTGLVFRKDSHQLFSASEDKAVKVWSLDEMSYVETMYGHQSGITAIDALSRERAVSAGGMDNSLRIWKIVEESQLIFNAHISSIECVKLINEENFVSGGDDGRLCVWGSMKKKPLCSKIKAHGHTNIENNWISCVATLLNTDLIASGSNDGYVRLWHLDNNFRSIEPLLEIPVNGFVNSLAFTSDGDILVAGVGQEHRLGRWWRNPKAKNAIVIIPLEKKST